MNQELPDVQAEFRKGRGTRDQTANIHWIIEKAAEFQRIARRDKKTFLSEQCKEIEESNRTGKTSDLFKKIRDTKGTFNTKMGSKKNRNGMDLTAAKDIKRWKEYMEELYKKRSSRPR